MISVIIPLYNKEPIIERSLQSVLTQDYDDFEVIVVNDGSTDKSAEIVKSINDSRITLIEQENGGPSKARNTGVRNAKGEWIVFLDADDELLPNALRHYADLITENPNIYFFACNFHVKNNDSVNDLYYYKNGVVQNCFKSHFHNLILPRTGSTICTKKLANLYPYNEDLRRYEDFENIFLLYKKTPLYISNQFVLTQNQTYACASRGRKDINEDFVGHLDFKGKPFWEKMCLYKLFIEERVLYRNDVNTIYRRLFYRFDLFLIYKIIGYLRKNRTIWNLYLRINGLSQFAK